MWVTSEVCAQSDPVFTVSIPRTDEAEPVTAGTAVVRLKAGVSESGDACRRPPVRSGLTTVRSIGGHGERFE